MMKEYFPNSTGKILIWKILAASKDIIMTVLPDMLNILNLMMLLKENSAQKANISKIKEKE